MASKFTNVTVSIPTRLLKRIDACAKIAQTTRSAFIVEALQDFLDNAEQSIKVMANPRIREALLRSFSQPGVLKGVAESLGHELKESERQHILEFLKPAEGKGASCPQSKNFIKTSSKPPHGTPRPS